MKKSINHLLISADYNQIEMRKKAEMTSKLYSLLYTEPHPL